MPAGLQYPVKYLRGVGEQRAALLAAKGIETAGDLLLYLPFRYEDRTAFVALRDVQPGEVSTVFAEVKAGTVVRFRHHSAAMYHLTVSDPTGRLHARFFHGAYLDGRFKPGQKIILHGKAEIDRLRPAVMEMLNPEFEIVSGEGVSPDSTEMGRIVPIYEAIGALSSRMLRRIVYSLLNQLTQDIAEILPASLRERYALPMRRDALLHVHFPGPDAYLDQLNQFRTPAHRRLIFEEFFYYQLGVGLRRRMRPRAKGIPMLVRDDRIRDAVKRTLPFKPTNAQKRVLGEIAADMERGEPMNRLLEGDVGSGKTLVALEAAVIAIENGYQAALMAPTEILASQHYLSARRVFEQAGYRVEFLASGLRRAEKQAAMERVSSGEAQFVVGTHALIEEAVRFHKLGFVIVDEQHRFGVLQRKRLIEKGTTPHVLVMTATPIPRTLALTLYGDLDVSVLDEMPPGRAPVESRWTTDEKLPSVWEFVRREIRCGRQGFVIYPVIEESVRELKAATAEYERLASSEFQGLRVGLLHGRLRTEEKDAMMERFRSGEVQVLVATTVVEVGVDVPNATVMVIEHAGQFGLAQLHQLRGRIGRGRNHSTCILVAGSKVTPEARERLETLVSTTNGFEIAEKDLQIRGPGEFFGTRQHGDMAFAVAHPLRDRELLELARREALALTDDPAQAAALHSILGALGPAWEKRYNLASVG
jgi:ATP-dependent DNA helicase RecG